MSEGRPAAAPARQRTIVVLLHVLTFASGAAALAYEIVWTRRLTFVFGASIYAVSAVLAAYMAGLSVGSLLGAARSKRPHDALRLYALLEAGIGIAGLAVPAVLRRLHIVDTWLYDGRVAHGGLTPYRFALALIALGLPASLMGATFPVLVRVMEGVRANIGSRVATLYGANVAGAVAGTFLSGFYLIGRLGVTRTEYVAVATNLSVAIVAAALWRARTHAPPDGASLTGASQTRASQTGAWQTGALSRPVDIRAGTLLVAVAVAGASAIACEVLWSRALAFAFSWLNNTTYAFPAMLGVFLGGLALGSAIIAPFVERGSHPVRLYGVLVTLAGVSVSVSAVVMTAHGSAPLGHAVDDAGNLYVARALINAALESAAVVGVPALLFGAAFPVAVRAVTPTASGVGPVVARVYAASTAGAIAGSLVAVFVVIPRLGITHGTVAIGGVLAITGIVVVAGAPASRRRFTVPLAALSLGTVACVQWRLPARALLTSDAAPVVFYEEGPTATVAVVRARDGFLRIDVDGVPVAGTSPTMLTDQKSLAHYPMMLARHPRRALTVGFGSGGTSHSFLLHAQLERVDAVEIAPEILHGAPYLTASNHGVLTRRDPRYRVILDDARSYLAHTRQTYDIIATDCTDLRYRSNANLYDLEYFQFCRARLSPDGLVAVWMPLGGLSRAMFQVALRTFGEVFRDFLVFWPNGYPSHYVILVGWRNAREVRWNRLVERLAPRVVQDDLREIALADPVRVLSTLVADGRGLQHALRNAPVNTEDHPVLEFLAPLSGYSPDATIDNLRFLLDHRDPVATLVDGGLPADAAARLARMESALPDLANAHAASFAGDTVLATRLYLEALALAPEDDAVRARVTELLPDVASQARETWNAPVGR